MLFAERLELLRKSVRMTQKELANKVGKQVSIISNWENGTINPSVDSLIKLTEVFKVSSDYLLGLDDRKYLDITNLDDNTAGIFRLLVADCIKK